jgi:hypothetical protein
MSFLPVDVADVRVAADALFALDRRDFKASQRDRGLEHDPEKWKPVFPRDKRGTRLRGDHAQTKR